MTHATMTLNLPAREMEVLTQLAEEQDLTKTQLMRQALRLYQLVHVRLKAGERLIFSGDQQRTAEFIGIGLDPLVHFQLNAEGTKSRQQSADH